MAPQTKANLGRRRAGGYEGANWLEIAAQRGTWGRTKAQQGLAVAVPARRWRQKEPFPGNDWQTVAICGQCEAGTAVVGTW
ncbi:MAG: hypothetical protein ABSG68_20740 [Thermoguttaceae bacterium]